MVDLNAMLRMDGKAAVVTGGASGIGFGIARFLAEVGASVALLDVDKTRGENNAERIRKNGGRAGFYFCDVRDSDSVENAVDAVVEDFQRIDFLVNCAGVIRRAGVVELEEKDWDLTMDVGLKGVFLVSKYVIPHMQANSGGKIVKIGSGWSFRGGEKAFCDCAAKAGVIS
jgi:NAD(P)-dependent dehydrogenase (short-subunit alcohol dehydrogenase family)